MCFTVHFIFILFSNIECIIYSCNLRNDNHTLDTSFALLNQHKMKTLTLTAFISPGFFLSKLKLIAYFFSLYKTNTAPMTAADITLTSSIQQPAQGQEFTLTCQVSGATADDKFEWFKGNDVNPLSGQDSNALVLTTEEGRFRCFFWVID